MDPPATPQLEQLTLPLAPTEPGGQPNLPPRLLAPPRIWGELPPGLRTECRRTLAKILGEVMRDDPICAEDRP